MRDRESYTHEEWTMGNQENYRVNTTLNLAQRTFSDASFHPSVVQCTLGIKFCDDRLVIDCPSLLVDLKGNGILIRDLQYQQRAEQLAKVLELDERLGKFVFVRGMLGWENSM